MSPRSLEALLKRMFHQRGPGPGHGRGPGRPWRGIVEETPCLWVTWLAECCRRLVRPMPAAIKVGDTTVRIAWSELTFGRRYWFLCPRCGRRHEAIYTLGQDVGCRRCLRLGYKSQTHRPSNLWPWFDELWGRGKLFRRWRPERLNDEAVVRDLRRRVGERIEALLSQVSVPPQM